MQTSKIEEANILNIYNKIKIDDSRVLFKYLYHHLASFFLNPSLVNLGPPNYL